MTTTTGDIESGAHQRHGPVVFAYDGSELAKLAIDEAGRQLAPGRDALVLTVWQPFDVGFVPTVALGVNAAEIADVREAAVQQPPTEPPGQMQRASKRAVCRPRSLRPGKASSKLPTSTTQV